MKTRKMKPSPKHIIVAICSLKKAKCNNVATKACYLKEFY